jgi:hypothetical protein
MLLIVMNQIHRHLDPEEVERYYSGTTDPEEIVRVEEHLLICEDCRGKVEEADRFSNAMTSAAAELEQTCARRRTFLALAVAAGLILVATVATRWQSVRQPAVPFDLIAMRANNTATAPGGRSLEIHPDLTGLRETPAYRLEVVDRNGKQVWHGILLTSRGSAIVPAQSAGMYFVRIYTQAGELLREYALQIGT